MQIVVPETLRSIVELLQQHMPDAQITLEECDCLACRIVHKAREGNEVTDEVISQVLVEAKVPYSKRHKVTDALKEALEHLTETELPPSEWPLGWKLTAVLPDRELKAKLNAVSNTQVDWLHNLCAFIAEYYWGIEAEGDDLFEQAVAIHEHGQPFRSEAHQLMIEVLQLSGVDLKDSTLDGMISRLVDTITERSDGLGAFARMMMRDMGEA